MTGLPNVAALLAKAPLDATDRFEVSCIVGPCTEEEATELADALLDLKEAQKIHVGGAGISSFADDTPSVPALAAALIEAAEALEEIAGPGCDLVGPPETCLTGGYEDRCAPCWAESALARLVAFDASLKETTE